MYVPRCLTLALLCAGCAAAGPPVATPSPETKMRVTDRGYEVDVYHQSVVDARPVEAPVSRVWAVLGSVYAELGIQLSVSDAGRVELGNAGFRARPIDGKRLSTYLNCGSGVTGDHADDYEVTMKVVTRLIPYGKDSSVVATLVDASAKARDVSSVPLPCGSRGTLETHIF